jgi:hypothetical protein
MKTRLLVLAANAWILIGTPHARSAVASGCPSGQALRLTAQAPLLSTGALTQLNMANLFSISSGSNLVTVTVVNPAPQLQSFRLLFQLKAIPADPRLRESCIDPLPSEGGQGCWIQRKMLTTRTLQPGEVWVRTSGMLEAEDYQGKAIDPETSPFQKLLAREGAIPPGAIYLSVALMEPLASGRGQENIRVIPTSELPLDTCAEAPVQSFVASYQPTQSPTLLSPGASAAEGYQSTASSTPTFVFAGNLDGVDLGGEEPYRLSIWEVHENESMGETLDRRALRSARVDRSPVPWDPSWSALEPGKRYLWRVDAILRGTGIDWLPSTPFGFRIPDLAGASSEVGTSTGDATLGVSLPSGSGAPQPTSEQLEILQALSLIIGPYRPVLEELVRSSLPDPYGLRIGNRPATLAEFQDLVHDILEGSASVTGAEVRP